MSIDSIREILQALKIKYRFNNGNFHFTYVGIAFSIDRNNTVYVSKEKFGRIPHILKNGSVCVFSGIDPKITSNEGFELKETLTTYVPYLFGLSSEDKTGEFLMELEYYVRELLQQKCNIINEDILSFEVLEIPSPQSLWESLEELKLDCWYRISPVSLENEYVFVKRKQDCYQIKYDEGQKAKLRVSGDLSDSISGRTVFIGLGSVNSFVLKTMFSRGLSDTVIIDDDMVETGNLFRFAFPYRKMYKVDAAERFIQFVDSKTKVRKIYKKIVYTEQNKSLNYLKNCKRIVVSVDNFFSWIQIYYYISKFSEPNCEIIFIGVDTYGKYGKFFKITYKKEFFDSFKNFLLDIPNGSKREKMVGNGCGKSLAIYDEQDIFLLVESMLSSKPSEEIQYVLFDDR